jgi:hypothetical protein
MKEENCTCTDECLGYLTKTCKRIEEEPKQDKIMERFIANAKQEETLEEFIKSYVNKIDRSEDGLVEQCLKDAIKWQQERSYSEEDMLNFAEWCDDNYFRIGTTSFWAESLFDEKAIAYKTEELLEIYRKTL